MTNFSSLLRTARAAICRSTVEAFRQLDESTEIDDKSFSLALQMALDSGAPPDQIYDALDVNLATCERWLKGKNMPLDFARSILIRKMIAPIEAQADRFESQLHIVTA